MTQGLILAAGRGSRMQELTKDKPKGMIQLGGKPLLQWQIEAMKKGGISKIYFVGGYQIRVLKELGYPCFENPKWNQTNMVESLRCAREILMKEETVVSYADIVCSSEIFKSLIHYSSDLAVTFDTLWRPLWEARFDNPLEDAETFSIKEGKLVDIGRVPKGYDEVQGQYMGLMKFTPLGWKNTEEQLQHTDTRKMDMTTLLQLLLRNGVSIDGVPIAGKWCEADSQGDLQCYEKKLKMDTPWTHDWRS